MRYSVFTDTDWLYPDSVHSEATQIRLEAALGGHDGAQLLFDTIGSHAQLTFQWETQALPTELFQLVPVGVNENTAPTLMTTTDYESCRAYVTRQAPFQVFDALRPVTEDLLPGRLAVYLSVEVPENTAPGIYRGQLQLTENGSVSASVPMEIQVYHAKVPPLAKAKLGMLNFFDYEDLGTQHGVADGSPEYWELFRQYVRAQLRLRCTHILLPSGEPVFEDGVLKDFDFTRAETAGRIAREEGAPFLCGGHIAHWTQWDSAQYYPNWDPKTGVTTPEGYFQLRLYFSRWAETIARLGWQDCMTQALADEPQTYNESTYRILAAVCRKFLPGIPIIDAVETANLGGAIDIWVPKQDTYEKRRDEFDALKSVGETIWFYTCAFPAGAMMNRSMDLPLTVSRAVLWMGALYRLSGFLHWGFNYYIGSDIWHSACCPHKGALLPAGDAHIVYPGPDGPWLSMRLETQRGGAEDYELLMQAIAADPQGTDRLIRTVCESFRDYHREGSVLRAARRELLKILEKGCCQNAETLH